MYACSPRWPADWISEENLKATLQSLAGKIEPSPWGADAMSLNHGLHFTGGEPFLNFELLCEAAGLAHELGIPSLFVETNCFWARTDEETREKLETLRSRGIIGILVSINPFYLEYVPFECSERAIRIAKEVFGANVAVYQIEYYRMFKRLGISGRLPFSSFLEIEEGRDFTRNAEFFLNGRAPYAVQSYNLFPGFPASVVSSHPCAPAFIRSWHNHFDNYGHFVPGYCGGLSLGDCRHLDELLSEGIDLDSHPVLSYIVADNFDGFLGFAKDLGYRELPQGYLSKCHLCVDIRKFLSGRGEFEELEPQTFYKEVDVCSPK